MDATIEFINSMPDEQGLIFAKYYQVFGEDENAAVDVFINDMNKVKYTLDEDILVTQSEKQIEVAVLSKSEGSNVLIGLSIRKTTGPGSSKAQISRVFFNNSFLSVPKNQ